MASRSSRKKVMSKYDFDPSEMVINQLPTETMTVPDLVLSMAEIYRKYALTGDISSLPGKVRPVTFDDGDEFADSFESDEMVDTLLRARELRESAKSNTIKTQTTEPARQPDKGPSGQEDKPQDKEGTTVPSPKPPTTQAPSDQANDKELSDAK